MSDEPDPVADPVGDGDGSGAENPIEPPESGGDNEGEEVANTVWTQGNGPRARAMIEALRYLSVLPRTVRMDFSSDYVAGTGQTINVLKPVSAGTAKKYTAANRGARDAIGFNEVTQSWVPVKLETQLYNAVRLPDDWATFDMSSLYEQVIKPQAISIVESLPGPLITLMEAVKAPTASGSGADVATTADTALKFYSDGSNALDVITKLRARLNKNKVPFHNRYLAVGPAVEAALLSLPQLQKVDESGSDGVLREATIGRLFGFDVIAAYDLDDEKAVAYQKDAFAFVTRMARKPEGAPAGEAIAQDGFALRHIMQYNPLQLEDQSIVDTFYGAAVLSAESAVAAGLTDAPSGA